MKLLTHTTKERLPMLATSIHFDFEDRSSLVADISDKAKSGISWASDVAEKNMSALKYFLFILPLLVLIFVLSLPSLFLLWMLFKLANTLLRASFTSDLRDKIDCGNSYKEAKARVERVKLSLSKIEDLRNSMNGKTVIFKPLIIREVDKSILILTSYICNKEKVVKELDKPLLKGFDNFVVKEADLWNRRTPVYDYLL